MATNKEFDVELFFSALADRTRLRLLNLIDDEEVCVCFFVEVIGTNQPKISRHLAYLKRAGLVSMRKDWKWSHYRITPPENKYAAEAFVLIASVANTLTLLAPLASTVAALVFRFSASILLAPLTSTTSLSASPARVTFEAPLVSTSRPKFLRSATETFATPETSSFSTSGAEIRTLRPLLDLIRFDVEISRTPS